MAIVIYEIAVCKPYFSTLEWFKKRVFCSYALHDSTKRMQKMLHILDRILKKKELLKGVNKRENLSVCMSLDCVARRRKDPKFWYIDSPVEDGGGGVGVGVRMYLTAKFSKFDFFLLLFNILISNIICTVTSVCDHL